MTNFVAFQLTLFIPSVSGKTGVAAQPIGVGARSTPPCNAAKISPGSVYHVVGVDHRFWYAFKAMDIGLKADENEDAASWAWRHGVLSMRRNLERTERLRYVFF
jgi:hypothetical protein